MYVVTGSMRFMFSFCFAVAAIASSAQFGVCFAQEAAAVQAGPQGIEDAQTRPEFKIEVLDESFRSLIDPESEIKVVAEGFTWTEGPVWYKQKGVVLFSDVPNNKIYQLDGNHKLSIFLSPSGFDGESSELEPGSNGLMFDANGNLIVCDHGNRRVYRLSEDKQTRTTLVDRFEGKRFNSPNDLVIKSNGDLFFTDPPYGLKDVSKQELGHFGVYCLKPDGTVSLVTKDLIRPNGVVISPDEKTIYVAQSHRPEPVYMKYAINDDGTFGKGELLYDSSEYAKDEATNPGMPDGMVVDVKGNIWATGPGGVLVISPEGKLLGRVYTGAKTANCTFVGRGKTLVMTSGNNVLSVKTKVKGLGDWGEDNPAQLLPTDVVAELTEVRQNLIDLIVAEKFAELIVGIAPPEFVQKMKDEGRFEDMVKGFAERKVGRLKQMLEETTFTNASYSKEEQSVTFYSDDRNATFKKTDGEWKLQN